ncbi:hypothetical protein PoMZ_07206 [Pyricularia oryzae]|uniref:Uncharacterized protein n=1 Tax=Pyricularia oryzae TaxID=318829 RepID=A0A4P7NEI8_PYROR|nr:hypothetical protein PoMZ_07206 [Pyricularia oryzae]
MTRSGAGPQGNSGMCLARGSGGYLDGGGGGKKGGGGGGLKKAVGAVILVPVLLENKNQFTTMIECKGQTAALPSAGKAGGKPE